MRSNCLDRDCCIPFICFALGEGFAPLPPGFSQLPVPGLSQLDSLSHMQVDEADLSVHDGLELGHPFAERKKAVFHHLRIVFQLSLHLAMGDVSGVVFLCGADRSHEVFLIKGESNDVL